MLTDQRRNTVYVVERTAKPLDSYVYGRITGKANTDAKVLSANVSLGIPAGALPDTGKYEAENAALTACSVSSDNAASNMAEVTNLSVAGSSAITFSGVRGGSAIDIRYCTANNPGSLALYVNGAKVQDVAFSSTGTWSGTYATVTVHTTVPQGASVKLEVDGGAGANIDFIQVR
jgi:hypothetical protein